MEWRNFASLNSLLLYPNTVIFFVPDFGNVEAPLFDTQKEGGIGIVLFPEERCVKRENSKCGTESVQMCWCLLETKLG